MKNRRHAMRMDSKKMKKPKKKLNYPNYDEHTLLHFRVYSKIPVLAINLF